MTIRKLAHFSIRTSRLEDSVRFYVDILGLKVGFRPALGFPGAWLYQGDDEAEYGVVHLIGTAGDKGAVAAYLGERVETGDGTGALDHLAFLADDMKAFSERLEQHKITYWARTVPTLGLRQLFFSDPSGLTIEMNFPAAEAQDSIDGAHACRAN